jgi:hypothetical protein
MINENFGRNENNKKTKIGGKMKNTIILAVVLLTMTWGNLFAQFTPYGSARVGYWYANENKDWSSTGESRMNLEYYLQSNSRFGANFKNDDMSGRVEFGGSGSIRLLWAKYKMGSYSILIGQEETILTQKGTMNYGHELNFVGWGAIDDSRKAQVRFEMNNGFMLAFVEPMLTDVKNIEQKKIVLFPKINLGFQNKLADNIDFKGAFGLNQYTYDKDAGEQDESVLSYVVALLFDLKFEQMGLKFHVNYGQNVENYGLKTQVPGKAIWNATDKELVNVATMGGFGEFSYKVNDKTTATLGASYTSSNCDDFDNADSAMSAFAQLKFQLGKKFWLSPEAGILDKMKDKDENKQGSMMFFGTQLRMDF